MPYPQLFLQKDNMILQQYEDTQTVLSQSEKEIFIDEINTLNEMLSIRKDWEKLFNNSHDLTPFQSWEWNYAMAKNFSPSEKLKMIVGYNENHEIVGIAPLKLTYQRFLGIKVLEFIGSGPSDYLGFLVDEENKHVFTEALFNYIKSSNDWTILNLISLKTETVNLIEQYLPFEISSQIVCPCSYLPNTMQEFEKEVHKRELNSIKRQLRKLLPQNRLTYIVKKFPENFDDDINSFIELHQKRHISKGERGKFYSEARKVRFRNMAKLMYESGMLRMELLKIDSVLAAINFILVQNNKKYYYLSGMNPVFSNFKPGKILIYYMIEDAIEKGYTVFDFLQGNEDYKYFWTNGEIQLYSAVYFRTRMSSILWRKTKNLKEQMYSSPMIKKSYQKFAQIALFK